MSARWASSSALERIVQCAASAVLPQSRDENKFSKGGQDIHSALEAASSENPPEEIRLPDGSVVRVEDLQLPHSRLPEQAFGYDVVSDEFHSWGYVGNRAYPNFAYSVVAGTADVVGASIISVGDSTGLRCTDVVDYKSGSMPHEPDSWQMRSLAFMASHVNQTEYARTRITYVREGRVWHSNWKLWTPVELADTAKLLRRAYDAVQKAAWKRPEIDAGDVKRGSWCHFCPALQDCPYFAKILSGGRLGHLDTRDLVEAYNNFQSVRTAAQRLEDAIKALAAESPIDLGGGYYYGRRNGKFVRYKVQTAWVEE